MDLPFPTLRSGGFFDLFFIASPRILCLRICQLTPLDPSKDDELADGHSTYQRFSTITEDPNDPDTNICSCFTPFGPEIYRYRSEFLIGEPELGDDDLLVATYDVWMSRESSHCEICKQQHL